MKIIGERISVLKKDEVLSMVILATKEKKKTTLLFLWLLAWTVCGFFVLANYHTISDQNVKAFIIIYLSFWAYYEFKIGKAYAWRKWGKEKIWVSGGILHYKREINGKGKIYEFELNLIENLKPIEHDTKSFAYQYGQSFWVKGGETIQFNYQSKIVRFGLQLSENEVKSVIKELSKV
ncbi:MAG: hypothetical protein JSU07_04380 [Bacteroidetes bacterium]|nr:hypothetical protein [Bacteroidota bacterium]